MANMHIRWPIASTRPRTVPWRRYLGAAALCLSVLIPCSRASTQDALKIAAVVNDDVISVFDLAQRISLVITFSNLPNTQETAHRIAPDILGRLIIEKLRLQEAKRLKIEIEQPEIDASIARMESNASQPPGGMATFLKQQGIDSDTLTQQIRADLAWVRIVNELFRPISSVSEAEVDDLMNEIRRNAGKSEYLVAEIFLAFDRQSQAKAQSTAGRLHSQLKSGAGFSQLAHNFSQSASVQTGGDIGWVSLPELSPALSNAIQKLRSGEISDPVVTDEGIYILLLRDVRTTSGLETASPGRTLLKLQQLHLALAPEANAASVAATIAHAGELTRGARSCNDLAKIGTSQGSPLSGLLGEFDSNSLSPAVRQIVEKLPVSTPSQPTRTADGVAVMMVCERKTESGTDPIAEARTRIRSRLLNERLSRAADQHISKLRRQAFVEIRL